MQSAAPEAVDLVERVGGDADALRPRRPRRRPSSAPAACWRGGWSSAASGSCSSTRATSTGWDAHDDVEKNHATMCARTDKPIAGLLTDLKRRGLFESTLVIWGGEFGRMPMSESGKGRDHNPHGFSYWFAGAGIKGGTVHGATDAVGLRAEVDRVHVHDLHATILHLLGLDHTQLTFPHNGREERLTDTAGKVVQTDPVMSLEPVHGPRTEAESASMTRSIRRWLDLDPDRIRLARSPSDRVLVDLAPADAAPAAARRRGEADHGRGPPALGVPAAEAARGARGQGEADGSATRSTPSSWRSSRRTSSGPPPRPTGRPCCAGSAST